MSRSPEAQAVVRELPIRPAAVERPVPDVPRPIDAALFERPVIAATAVQRVQRERQRPVYCERWASHAEWQAANVNAVTSVLHRSRRHFCLAALATSLPWRAWAGFNFWNSEYTVTRSELQAMIATRFPLSQRYAQIVTVELSEPQLALNAAANRAAITAHVSIASPLLRAGQVNGTVTLSSALRYGAAMRALLL
jgi:hypothetical protein